jgi:protein-L-isoaspartate(D-aspartate) O-methyltransferase
VPRHLFLPEASIAHAFEDGPLNIGYGQTISQPFIVALMTELINPESTDRVLDVGTGSGYQAAVLAQIVADVFTVEIIPGLNEQAEANFKKLGFANIHTRVGDGYYGWPEEAPFDGIIVAAAPGKVPPLLLDQLAENGKLIIPVGDAFQYLELYTRYRGKILKETGIPVRFVPMTGQAEFE